MVYTNQTNEWISVSFGANPPETSDLAITVKVNNISVSFFYSLVENYNIHNFWLSNILWSEFFSFFLQMLCHVMFVFNSVKIHVKKGSHSVQKGQHAQLAASTMLKAFFEWFRFINKQRTHCRKLQFVFGHDYLILDGEHVFRMCELFGFLSNTWIPNWNGNKRL